MIIKRITLLQCIAITVRCILFRHVPLVMVENWCWVALVRQEGRDVLIMSGDFQPELEAEGR